MISQLMGGVLRTIIISYVNSSTPNGTCAQTSYFSRVTCVLDLPQGGKRDSGSGLFAGYSGTAYYWYSSPNSNAGGLLWIFGGAGSNFLGDSRNSGSSLRCLRN